MTPKLLNEMIRATARHARNEQGDSSCPTAEWISRFPARLSLDELTHIAFCPHCHSALHVHHTGDVFREKCQSPDLKKLLSRITRSARWEQIKDAIAEWIDRSTYVLPETSFAFARLPDESPSGLGLTVFEINLTPEKLSREGLRIDRYAPTDDPQVMQLMISGFDPAIEGHDARVGLCPRDTILKICRQEPLPIPPDLEKIEQTLQKIFLGHVAGATSRMNQIGSQSIWNEGSIEPASGNRWTLSVKLPAHAADYFVRGEYWAILIVG